MVRDGILVPVMDLERDPEAFVEENEVEDDEELGGQQEEDREGAISDAVSAVRGQVDEIAKAVNEVRSIPEVKTAGEVAQPVVIATAASSVVALGSSFNLIPYLQYIFSGPIAWFARRRKKGYGSIYDADLLTPIPLVSIKLVREDGTVAGSAISDEQGHFFLRVQPGKYRLIAQKKGYNQVVESPRKSVSIENLYTSGFVEVTDNDILISPVMLLSKSDAHATINTPKRIKRRRFVRAVLQAFGLSGTILAALAFIVLQTPFSLLMVFVQLLAFALTRKLANKSSHKGWGIVQDSIKKEPVSNAVVRLFDPEYNKLLETTLTDGKGRYAILAGPSEYYATIDKAGYQQTIVQPIDFSNQKEPRLVSVNVSLQPAQK